MNIFINRQIVIFLKYIETLIAPSRSTVQDLDAFSLLLVYLNEVDVTFYILVVFQIYFYRNNNSSSSRICINTKRDFFFYKFRQGQPKDRARIKLQERYYTIYTHTLCNHCVANVPGRLSTLLSPLLTTLFS